MNNRKGGDGSYCLRVLPEGKTYPCRGGQKVWEVLAGGEVLASDCGGKGRCGKCLVRLFPPGSAAPPTAAEREFLRGDELAQGLRLACLTVISGDLEVTIPRPDEFLEDSPKQDLTGEFPVDPAVRRLPLSLGTNLEITPPGPDLLSQVSDLIKKVSGEDLVIKERDMLGALGHPATYRGEITLVGHRKCGLTAVIHGRRFESFGFAFDIGTTTVAAYLCDLRTGRIAAAAASTNPQRAYGEDVISRIAFAGEREDGLPILQGLIVAEMNGLMNRCLTRAGITREEIDEVVVAGNTAMGHLVAGIHPYGLGVAPYLPVTRGPLDIRAGDLGLNLGRSVNVHILPVVSGFVGGDTVAAVVAARLGEGEADELLIDIGTNGELVVGNNRGLYAASCATGPALEGAHISAGMRAAPGAIDRVVIDEGDYSVDVTTIGGGDHAPRGICGSGIIDAVAELLKKGIMSSNGRLNVGFPGVIPGASGLGEGFVLASAGKERGNKAVSISISDIRQVQLAKGALSAGIKMLMKKARIDGLKRIIFTGAFGARFNWRNALTIGMLPALSPGTEVVVRDNLAGLGAVEVLLDWRKRRAAEDLARKIAFLELAGEADFPAEYIGSLDFPDQARKGQPKTDHL